MSSWDIKKEGRAIGGQTFGSCCEFTCNAKKEKVRECMKAVTALILSRAAFLCHSVKRTWNAKNIDEVVEFIELHFSRRQADKFYCLTS